MLRDFGNSRVLKTSYFWLLFVPLAARTLASIEKNLSLTIFGEVFNFTFDLPFSWKVFYYAAVSFSIAGIVYSWRCPAIVKRYTAFPSFVEEGRGVPYLLVWTAVLPENVANHVKQVLEEYEHGLIGGVRNAAQLPANLRDQAKLADAFWTVYNATNYSDKASLVACFVFYAVGFVLLTVVMGQNFIYVVGSTF
jgi:hypothetical protein